ncbi:MAG: TonB-dependent receptor plug domain-containing protein [Saprospiraceae bacterium]|nr:TonB-dependent receptor plug domain-containing protein [Saprospiraceae bacterium]
MANIGNAQSTATISGYVIDEKTGEALIGANVYIDVSNEGTVTNNFGFYSISLPKGTSGVLNYSYIGYVSKALNFELSSDLSLNVGLSSSIELEEVEVIAEKNKRIERETQMSVSEIPMAQLKKVPALFGEVDVLKALQLMPGVKSGGEGQSGLYVRGGGPDQNLILLDGVPVYNASHLFGFFSVFNADAIKDVKLIKGGFPARYGGRLSSVLDISMKEGNLNEFHGTASIGLIASKLTLEGPINKGKTSFIVSGRRTYIDLLAKPLIKANFRDGGSEGDLGYFFYDLNAKINHKFSDKDRLYLSAYTGRDKFFFNNEDKNGFGDYSRYSENALFWGNFTSSLRWNHLINPKMFVNTTATFSNYKLNTDLEFGERQKVNPDLRNRFAVDYLSGIRDFALKIDVDYLPSPGHFLRFGANAIQHQFNPGVFNLLNEDTETNLKFAESFGQDLVDGLETALFIEDDYNISNKLKVNGGLHFSTFTTNKKTYASLQPRFSGRYLLKDDWSVKSSFASMRQYINLLAFEGIGLPTDLWVPATDRIRPQDSWQVAVGTAKTFKDVYEFSTEVYYKKMYNLVAYKDGAGIFQTDDWQNRVVQGDGRSYGLELLLQKKEGKFTGWVGYTLAWAYRQFPEIDNGIEYFDRYDRRHDFSIVGNYNLSKKINFAATWIYSSGNPVTLPTVLADDRLPGPGNGHQNTGTGIEYFGSRNNYRIPSYHRLDIGVNFVKQKKRYERIWSVGAYNTYSSNNPFYLYINNTSKIENGMSKTVRQLTQASLFPIIPYVTWTANF